MRFICADEIDRALTFPDLIDALGEAFRGNIVTPIRYHHDIARAGSAATLLLMPAWTGAASGAGFVGVKISTLFPDNARKNLPTFFGTYLLLNGDTGAPLVALDGARLTLWRTAAASALAARYLARGDARRMAMIGAGALAPFLIRAHVSQRPIGEVAIWNHRPEKAEAVAAALRTEGLPIRAAADLESAVREADLVSCATLSSTPLIKGTWLRPGAHLDLVGAFKPGMREADEPALQRASIYVDTDLAKTEGGDVAEALKSGALAEGDVSADLAALCRGAALGRRGRDEITVFKSVGTALEDLVAAMLVWRRMASTS